MLAFLPSTIRGFLTLMGYVVIILCLGLLIFILAPFKYIVPLARWRRHFTHIYRQIPLLWNLWSNRLLKWMGTTQWEFEIRGTFDQKKSYILISNHQSWMDIIVVQKAISQLAPPSVYFMKRQLLWLPVLGWACWLLGFPYMRRYSKQFLQAHPEKVGHDLATAKKACERYRDFPVTIVNFTEGTRRTAEKYAQQQPPYKHLLNPRAGGVAYALEIMGEQIDSFMNVTLVYPNDELSMWDMFCGRAKKIIARIDNLAIPNDLRQGRYLQDEAYREKFYTWLKEIWAEKDKTIEELRKTYSKMP